MHFKTVTCQTFHHFDNRQRNKKTEKVSDCPKDIHRADNITRLSFDKSCNDYTLQ